MLSTLIYMQCRGVCQFLCLSRQQELHSGKKGKSYVRDFTKARGNACLSIASDSPSCFPTGVNQSLSNDGGASSGQSDTVDTNISI
jgi:hypothetical protein